MELTEYQCLKFQQFQTLEPYKFYAISDDRPDREEFINAVKLYMDCFGTAELSSDYKKFRFIWHPRTLEWMEKYKDTL